MDTLGLLLAVVVTAARVQDRGRCQVVAGALPGGCKAEKVWVDGGYWALWWTGSRRGSNSAWRWCCAQEESRKFVLLPGAGWWNTFGWLNHSRR